MLAEPKPRWLTVTSPGGSSYQDLKGLFRGPGPPPVCDPAHCPNVGECGGGGTATIMLMGDVCSRACRFCMVTPGKPNGSLDQHEPENVAFALSQLGLTYVVLTSVDRDDLPDGGASHFAQTIRLVKEKNPGMLVEVLIPDFQGDLADLKQVVDAEPDVIAHNIETTMTLSPKVRDPRAQYWQSLSVLRNVKKLDPRIHTKSSVMVGLGETEEEVGQAMAHLRLAGVDFLTVGQYLRPSPRHLKVVDYVEPSQFARYRSMGEQAGFLYTASGPLVRSSYRAGEFFIRTAMRDGPARRQSYMGAEAEKHV